uniref:Uncharacterized protein n=1 Tax=viral metagenome TaxID=1070528 RepID=A0A6H1ZQD4_9ZZZZ
MPSKKGDHGLAKQITYTEESIGIGEALGKDKSYERMLVKEWRLWLPGGPKYHLWLDHSKAGYRFLKAPHKPTTKK